MAELEEASPEYIKGFNDGYMLTKHEPELADKLSVSMPDTERGNGFKKGREELLKELENVKMPDWLKKNRTSNLKDENYKNRGKSREDLER